MANRRSQLRRRQPPGRWERAARFLTQHRGWRSPFRGSALRQYRRGTAAARRIDAPHAARLSPDAQPNRSHQSCGDSPQRDFRDPSMPRPMRASRRRADVPGTRSPSSRCRSPNTNLFTLARNEREISRLNKDAPPALCPHNAPSITHVRTRHYAGAERYRKGGRRASRTWSINLRSSIGRRHSSRFSGRDHHVDTPALTGIIGR